MESVSNTEQQIIAAAKKIFFQRGMSGARMQDIADEAGINKALLHYYFRSKDKLFDMVFEDAIGEMFSNIKASQQQDLPLDQKIAVLVNSYINVISKNPYLPQFILHEVNQQPERMVKRMTGGPNFPEIKSFFKDIQAGAKKGFIRKVDPLQLVISVLSMCIFPFVARPMIQGIFEMDNKQFNRFIEERRTFIVDFVKAALRP
ncbi:TetR/AcrR family transcriptional regulator [Chitinophaga horti]|uniref:TetR/AcrR family transcriptional regulator n=1 Tax=Chitinophaga horti TaxID=2920382 RepID=A0ABY6J899_9BACT|nr:TetR/AcrR family transcriptional regulator [Chitinophaga horti]UYQ94374.1 TetR/AcrR family transcriptional regulator [Chitinophaga horti]